MSTVTSSTHSARKSAAQPIPAGAVWPRVFPLAAMLAAVVLGLPALPGVEVRPRPAWMAPAPFNYFGDSMIVERSWTFAPPGVGKVSRRWAANQTSMIDTR